MKNPVSSANAASSSGTRRRQTPARAGDYAPVSETRALLAGSLVARQQRLAASDMLSTDEAAQLVGATRVTVNAWIAKGRAIGLTQVKRGYRMPRWQFEPLVWDALPQISSALGVSEGWALLSFLESPHGALGGLTPRQAIEQGLAEQVTAIARQEGH